MPARKVPERVQERLRNLPALPGCYIYKDAQGQVLYVGKAVSLRSRVRSYFQPSARHTMRIARLVHKTEDIETIVVDSELEALVLECNLIKEHRPPFNVRLRDDKSYPYIAITNEAFPRVLFTRNPRKGWAKYFGPYTSAWSVRDTLKLLHKVFPLIPCGKSWRGTPDQRPCLYYHIGQCLAPCAGLAKREEYLKVIADVEKFLQGKHDKILEDLRLKMDQAVADLDFEGAASLRDRIQSIEGVLQRQKVLSEDKEDRDVIAVVKDERGAAIQMLYVRGGRLIGQRHFMLDGSVESSPTEAVQSFVKQYYSDAPDIPREILLPVEIEERNIVQQWLRTRRGAAVTMAVPEGGDKLRLVDMAASNAEQALRSFALEMEQKEAWADQAVGELSEALELPTPALRIEGFDISNISGRHAVGSMVVVENGEAARGEYRRFRIRMNPEEPNDFAMMKEVVGRRLQNYLDGDGKFAKAPDLVMIDGGKGQLGAALAARDELGLAFPMVGLAKRMEIVYVPIEMPSDEEIAELGYVKPVRRYQYREVVLPLNSPGLMLLRKLRDEAHRFAITYHRKVREKRAQGSLLDEIPGIGPRRRRLLLRTFGSVEQIRSASVEDIASVPTMTRKLAEEISVFLRSGG